MRMFVRFLSAVTLAPLGGLFTPSSAQSRPAAIDAVPVYRESRHRLVFENAYTRILDVRIPVGDTSRYHVHADRQMGIVISAARTWQQYLGKPAQGADSSNAIVGSISDNAKATLPYTHRVANAGTTLFHYVAGQFRKSSGIPAEVLPASSGLTFDHESMGARIYRVTVAPGQSTALHLHARPGLTVQVTNGSLQMRGTKPEAGRKETGAGAWYWRAGGTNHTLRNTGKAPVQVIEIDWP